MVLEYLLNEKIQSKSYYIIDFDKQTEVNIGRGSQCQLKLKDISISRNHACLQLKKGQIYFSDKQSKFGSLVYLQDSIKAQPETMYNIQCGRTTISLQIKQKSLDIQQILKRYASAASLPSLCAGEAFPYAYGHCFRLYPAYRSAWPC